MQHLRTYSPHLNLIEILWIKIKYDRLEPDNYKNIEIFEKALENILTNIGSKFKINFSEESIFTSKYDLEEVAILND